MLSEPQSENLDFRLCLVREKNLDFDTVPLGAKPAENGDGVFAYCTLESLLSENIDEQ